jgi:hypothetical protein
LSCHNDASSGAKGLNQQSTAESAAYNDGMAVGAGIYGVTQWVSAIGLGPAFGVTVAIVIAALQK